MGVDHSRSSTEPVQRIVKLSASGLANIPGRNEFNDFTFAVGDCRHSCPAFVADFLSPKIAHQHGADLVICEYVVETKDLKRCFEGFISLSRGSSLSLTSANQNLVLSLSGELENEELFLFSGEKFYFRRRLNSICSPKLRNVF
jgi:hypothetical protein